MKELLEVYQAICANIESIIVSIGLLLLLLWPIKCIIDKVAHKIFSTSKTAASDGGIFVVYSRMFARSSRPGRGLSRPRKERFILFYL